MHPLQPIACLYGKIAQWRNQLYDNGKRTSIRFTVPTIAIGNLCTGGTGKTPMAAYIVEQWQDQCQIALLSRGYRRRSKGFVWANANSTADDIGDEPAQLKRRFPRLEVAVAENRALGIPLLLYQLDTTPDFILLDDAFQHRVVQPHLSILLTTYDQPYTRNYLLPRGTLREPIAGATRADIIIVTKAPVQLSDADRQALITELAPTRQQIVLFAHLQYGTIYPLFDGIPNPPNPDDPQTGVLLACGIAQPRELEQYARSRYTTLKTSYFGDHHRYTPRDWQNIETTLATLPTTQSMILTTEKDAPRWLQLHQQLGCPPPLPIYCLPVTTAFAPQDAAILRQAIEKVIAK